MNAKVSTAVELLIKKWGLTDPSKEIQVHAERCISLSEKKTGEIVAALGILSSEEVESRLAEKPVSYKTLDWLKEYSQPIVARYDEIMAIQQKFLFVGNPTDTLHLHPIMSGDKSGIADECSRKNMLPVLAEGRQTVLLFGDISKLTEFRARNRAQIKSCPIFKALVAENINTDSIVYGIASNNMMMGLSHSMDSSSESGAEGDNQQIIYQREGESDPLINRLIGYLNLAMHQGVNDIWIQPHQDDGSGIIYFRNNQMLRQVFTIDSSTRIALVNILGQRSKANPSSGRVLHPLNGSATFKGKSGTAFLRLSFIPVVNSGISDDYVSVSIRVLPREIKEISLESLNIDDEIINELRRLAVLDQGLILVCGPTNSGKSTTIAGIITEHERYWGIKKKRLSLEQPVERLLKGVAHIDVSKHIYREPFKPGENEFTAGMRAVLRHDPDLVYIGEVLGSNEAITCSRAANSGHLVLSTIHANDPVTGYKTVANYIPTGMLYDLVQALEAVLAQRLLPCVCQECGILTEFDEPSILNLEAYARHKGIRSFDRAKLPKYHRVANPEGCDLCLDGYSSMIPVHGLLLFTPEIKSLLVANDPRDLLKVQEMTPYKMFDSAFRHFVAGRIDIKTVTV
jgi:type II secretory ATPase GspE/PulE/Tfp pilus assembly ATPase PilB-like protein